MLDTAKPLAPSRAHNLYVLKLQADVDSLSLIYEDIKTKCDRCNQTILIISSLGALTSSITSLAGASGWQFEIIPIIVQTLSGVLAAWIRFYDFPKRMEEIINCKKSANDARMKFEVCQIVTPELWNDYSKVQHEIAVAISPHERRHAMKLALLLRRQAAKFDNDIHQLAEGILDEGSSLNDALTTQNSDEISLEDENIVHVLQPNVEGHTSNQVT